MIRNASPLVSGGMPAMGPAFRDGLLCVVSDQRVSPKLAGSGKLPWYGDQFGTAWFGSG